MEKIANWDSLKLPEQGQGRKLPPGAYIIKILRVEDMAMAKDKPQAALRLEYDIIEGDYKGFFNDKYQDDDRRDKKWAGFFYVNYGGSDKVQQWFKAFITSIEESNTGFKWNWLPQSLVGKVVCYAFGEVEKEVKDRMNPSKTNVIKIVQPRFPHSVRAYREGSVGIPKPRLLSTTTASTPQQPSIKELFEETAARAWGDREDKPKKVGEIGVDITDDDLPF